MSLTESINKIVAEEAKILEAQGVFELIDRYEWFIDRYQELMDEAMADRVDDFFEIEMYIYENDLDHDYTEDLKLMYQEYCDAYAANELGDQLWEEGIDPWDYDAELCAEDMQRDANIEIMLMCQAAEAEEAYWDEVRRKELELLQEKLDDMD